MQGIPLEERKRLGALLDTRPQTEVMAMISQFSQAETDNFVAPPAQVPKALGVLMFNMERGVNLPEIQEFLRDCPDPRQRAGRRLRPFRQQEHRQRAGAGIWSELRLGLGVYRTGKRRKCKRLPRQRSLFPLADPPGRRDSPAGAVQLVL